MREVFGFCGNVDSVIAKNVPFKFYSEFLRNLSV